jgi:hypothetical protein
MQITRWNQRYLDEELVLLYGLQDQLYETNLIRESGEKIEFAPAVCPGGRRPL